LWEIVPALKKSLARLFFVGNNECSSHKNKNMTTGQKGGGKPNPKTPNQNAAWFFFNSPSFASSTRQPISDFHFCSCFVFLPFSEMVRQKFSFVVLSFISHQKKIDDAYTMICDKALAIMKLTCFVLSK